MGFFRVLRRNIKRRLSRVSFRGQLLIALSILTVTIVGIHQLKIFVWGRGRLIVKKQYHLLDNEDFWSGARERFAFQEQPFSQQGPIESDSLANEDAQNDEIEHRVPEIKIEELPMNVETSIKTIRTANTTLSLSNHTGSNANRYKIEAGFGENGQPVIIDPSTLTEAEKVEMAAGKKRHSFNEFVSDKVSLNRSLPDELSKECSSKSYPIHSLPSVAVIITFHNEAWSVLMRTIYSVIYRSPPELLNEIILVDDCSTFSSLGEPLDISIKELSSKIKVIRMSERAGLIKSRLAGVDAASSDVLVFLDSHCECAEGWLPPLLTPITMDQKVATVPQIDGIDGNTFQYLRKKASDMTIGGFVWDMTFTWIQTPPRLLKKRSDVTEALESPTMIGGLFAINRTWFLTLGGYDPELKIWGGENMELSFKIWMCGGSIMNIPCSHVGHVFRSPVIFLPRKEELNRNLGRVAEVWLDHEFKPYFYEATNANASDIGDISARLQLKANLQCKSFKWYLETIYPEQYVPHWAVANGKIRHTQNSAEYCLDYAGGTKLHAMTCENETTVQDWGFRAAGDIFKRFHCFTVDENRVVGVQKCDYGGKTQEYSYDTQTKQIYNKFSNGCLEATIPVVRSTTCDPTKQEQRFIFDNFNISRAQSSNRLISLHPPA